jgi:soluble lytic murein transglycosylase-like protein
MRLTHVLSGLATCAVLAVLGAPPVAHADPAPFPVFEAKWVKPPSPGTTRRITVQIAPAPKIPKASVPETVETESQASDASVVPTAYAGFWSRISADLPAASPARLDAALAALVADPVAAPRLGTLERIARDRGADILKATVGRDVSPALVLAVIAIESGGRSDAVSPAGAVGLMQLMPATAARFDVTDRRAPADNIDGGVRYLSWLLDRFGGDPVLALAGYNAGEGAVDRHGGVPPYRETRDFVPKVLAAFSVARGLCRTPPELVSDGCVFVTMS